MKFFVYIVLVCVPALLSAQPLPIEIRIDNYSRGIQRGPDTIRFELRYSSGPIPDTIIEHRILTGPGHYYTRTYYTRPVKNGFSPLYWLSSPRYEIKETYAFSTIDKGFHLHTRQRFDSIEVSGDTVKEYDISYNYGRSSESNQEKEEIVISECLYKDRRTGRPMRQFTSAHYPDGSTSVDFVSRFEYELDDSGRVTSENLFYLDTTWSLIYRRVNRFEENRLSEVVEWWSSEDDSLVRTGRSDRFVWGEQHHPDSLQPRLIQERKSEWDTDRNDWKITGTFTYSYDTLGRLIEWPRFGMRETYEYFGNSNELRSFLVRTNSQEREEITSGWAIERIFNPDGSIQRDIVRSVSDEDTNTPEDLLQRIAFVRSYTYSKPSVEK